MDNQMGLRDIGMVLPPGFRFYPSDEELICHYLYNKITNEKLVRGTLVDVDLHTCEPWQLPDVAKLNSSEWYFFSFRNRKYATGHRTNRATTSGYWKATGKDRVVLNPTTKNVVGMRKTLVFYKNRAPNGIKTGWLMHEFRLENPHVTPKEDWVLCRVFHQSRGEKNDKIDPGTDPEPRGVHHNLVIDASPLLSYQRTEPSVSCTLSSGYFHMSHNNYEDNESDMVHCQDPNVTRATSPHNPEITKYGVDDDYGLMLDTSFFDYPLLNGVPAMRFNADGGAPVFI